MPFQRTFQEFKVEAGELVDKVKDLIHEGNIRRIIIKDASGNTFMEIPLNIAAIGVVAAPLLSALGALAALVAKFTVVIERTEEPPAEKPAEEQKAAETQVTASE
jgi:hypothetical protein